MISKGWPHARKICCYFDNNKKIAYYGECIIDEKTLTGKSYVIKIHNPNILSTNMMPNNSNREAYIIVRQVVAAYNPTEVIKYRECYFPVIMVGNDFENDLLKAGIPLGSFSFADEPSFPVD